MIEDPEVQAELFSTLVELQRAHTAMLEVNHYWLHSREDCEDASCTQCAPERRVDDLQRRLIEVAYKVTGVDLDAAFKAAQERQQKEHDAFLSADDHRRRPPPEPEDNDECDL